MEELDDDLRELADNTNLPCEIIYDSPNKVIAQLTQRLETHIGDSP